MSRFSALFAALLFGAMGLNVFAKETRLLGTDEGWVAAGSFARGSIYPISDASALGRSKAIGPSPVLWGSWAGDDAHKGTLRSPIFEAPALLTLLVTGHPGAAGNSLFLQRERDGGRHPLASSSPGSRWHENRFFVPEGFRGERVRLVAIDGATERSGWLGVSTPRAINPPAWILGWIDDTSTVSLGAVLTLFCVAWVLRTCLQNTLPMERRRALAARSEALARRAVPIAVPIGVGIVYVLHCGVLYRYAVDIPYLSEWHFLSPSSGLDFAGDRPWKWIWRDHAGERIVFTKLQVWLLYWTGGWNLRTQIFQNFALYCAALSASFVFVKTKAPRLAPPMLLCFFVFPLTSVASENLQSGISSRLHFEWLFVALTAHFAFLDRGRIASAIAAAACGVAAMLSCASGAAAVAGLVSVFAVYTAVQRRAAPLALARLGLLALPVGLVIAAGWGGSIAASRAAAFWSSEFALRYLDLVSAGFGVSSKSPLLGAFWLATAVAPFVALVLKGRGRLAADEWALLALWVAVLANSFASAATSAGLESTPDAATRHTELAALLLPLSAAGWSALLSSRDATRRSVLAGILALAAFASLDDWSTKPYRLSRVGRADGVECARRYYANGGEASCPTIARRSISRELDRARELGLHFYRQIEQPR